MSLALCLKKVDPEFIFQIKVFPLRTLLVKSRAFLLFTIFEGGLFHGVTISTLNEFFPGCSLNIPGKKDIF